MLTVWSMNPLDARIPHLSTAPAFSSLSQIPSGDYCAVHYDGILMNLYSDNRDSTAGTPPAGYTPAQRSVPWLSRRTTRRSLIRPSGWTKHRLHPCRCVDVLIMRGRLPTRLSTQQSETAEAPKSRNTEGKRKEPPSFIAQKHSAPRQQPASAPHIRTRDAKTP